VSTTVCPNWSYINYVLGLAKSKQILTLCTKNVRHRTTTVLEAHRLCMEWSALFIHQLLSVASVIPGRRIKLKLENYTVAFLLLLGFIGLSFAAVYEFRLCFLRILERGFRPSTSLFRRLQKLSVLFLELDHRTETE